LIRLGTNEEIDLCKTDTGHLATETTDFAFVSGRQRLTWEVAMNQFYTRRQTALDTTTRPTIVVLQETLTPAQSGKSYELPPSITEADGVDPDDIAAAPRLRHIQVMNGDDLYGCVCNATSFEAATSTIEAKVREVTA
jgi:hypothetical protein